jgi:RimJ/RimL family protein N-acetyltransferase
MRTQKNTPRITNKPPKGKIVIGEKIKLRDKKLADVRNDYKWQADPELARLDAAQVLITSFAVYLLDYAAEIHTPRRDRYPMAVETLDGKHIGNTSCYDIDDKKAEAQFGIMIGDRDYWDKGYGKDIVKTMVSHLFRSTGLKRIYLKTLDWNLRAHKCFMDCGFTPCGESKRNGYNFIYMEIFRDEWEKRLAKSLPDSR